MMTKTGTLGLAKQIEAHMARLVDAAGPAGADVTTDKKV
jgi:hypothetical protein